MKRSADARRVGARDKTAWRWWRAGHLHASPAASGAVQVRAPAEPTPFTGASSAGAIARLTAEVNGAFNIPRKGNSDAFGDGIGGVVLQPGQDCPGEWAAW